MSVVEIPQAVARQAVEWMLELQASPDSEPVREAWTRWRESHPSHERAWQRIETVRSRLQGAAAASAVAHATLAAPGSSRRGLAVKALSVLFFGSALALAVDGKTPWRRWVADLATDVGEQRRVTLADGTELMLDTGTAVDLMYRPDERRIRLLAGEIFIATARDPAGRPFRVETPQGLAQALGTRFTVRSLDDSSRVAVFEGAVRITPSAPGAHVLVLQAGQACRFDRAAAGPARAVDESDRAWTDGTLVARSMRLADFLAELGRYSPHPLSCDPAVADLRVSGSYPVARLPPILDALSAALSLQVETATRFWGRQVVGYRLTPRPG